MCYRLFIPFFSIVFSLVWSQRILARGLSVEDVLNLADQKSPDIELIRQTYEAGRYQARAYLAQALPRVDFSYRFAKNDIVLSPTQGGGTSGIDRLKIDDYSWSVNLGAPLYTFGRVGALYTMHRSGTDQVERQKLVDRDQVLRAILKAYVDALGSVRRVAVQKKAVERSRQNYSFVKLEYEGGATKRIDFLTSQARLQETEADYLKAEADRNGAIDLLKVLLGLDAKDQLELDVNQGRDSKFFQLREDRQVKNSGSLELARLTNEFSTANYKYRSAAYYPSIDAFASVSGQASTITDGLPEGATVEDEGFSESFDKGNRSVFYGLEFKWNLFAGGADLAEQKIAASQRMQAKIEYEKKLREEQILKQNAKIYLSTAQRIYEASLKSLEASKLALETANSEFKNGALSLTELYQEEEKFRSIEGESIQAFGALILATADYRINNGWEIQ